MAKNVVFDEQSAARIARSVKWTEQFTDPTDGDPLGETDLAGEANPDGGQTESVDVVTNVECVDGSLVITTATLRVPKQDP